MGDEAKYKKGDKVWSMWHQTPVNFTVIEIAHINQVWFYTLEFKKLGAIKRAKSIFATKEELLASL